MEASMQRPNSRAVDDTCPPARDFDDGSEDRAIQEPDARVIEAMQAKKRCYSWSGKR